MRLQKDLESAGHQTKRGKSEQNMLRKQIDCTVVVVVAAAAAILICTALE